jgi:tryptophanyl-tRNA synthetase
MKQQLSDRDLNMYGFLGYPLLQAVDIVLYDANFVPVGEDQVAHLEFARELIRRFQFITKNEILVEPQPILTQAARVPGTDGRKMSKSFDNAIYMADDEATVTKKMMSTITDPQRKRRDDPGDPDVCNIYAYHRLYTDPKRIAEIDEGCRAASIGCVDCKKECVANALKFWKPIREKREELAKDVEGLHKMLLEGSDKARAVADVTMNKVRGALGLEYKKLRM